MAFLQEQKHFQVVLILVLSGVFIFIAVSSVDGMPNEKNRIARNGLKNPIFRWKKFYIFIDPEFNDTDRKLIEQAASQLRKHLSCVQFKIWPKGISPSGKQDSYVHVTKAMHGGCSSLVGRNPTGPQKLELSPECTDLQTITHEMIHALGFHHEQARPDRDDFIDIFWENIRDRAANNFIKYGYKDTTTFDVPYNPKSIMHYSSRAFSKNEKPTILTKDGKTISYPDGLQQSDILKLKRMYKC